MAVGSILKQIITFPARKPITFGMGFSCIKTSVADLLVQRYVEKRKDIDWKRNSAFGIFGFLYLGGVQYFIYVPLFKRIFPSAEAFAQKSVKEKFADTAGQLTMVKQVVLDQCIHHPFLYFPVFYAMKEAVTGGSLSEAKRKYMVNFQEDIIALWKIWVPATVVNFTFMPMWGRIPFVATTSLFWTCLLSYMRGSEVLPISQPTKSVDTFGNQGRALTRALSRAPKLSPVKSHLVVTSVSESRGALTRLATLLKSNGGNIVRSTALFISGSIVVTMVVETEPDNITNVCALLDDFDRENGTTMGINKVFAPSSSTHDDHDRFECGLHVLGMDRPGILSEVSHFLDDNNIRIESFVQGHAIAESQDHMVFDLRLVVSSDQELDIPTLQEQLTKFGSSKDISLNLVPKDYGNNK